MTIDENIDLTLEAVFAGDDNPGLLLRDHYQYQGHHKWRRCGDVPNGQWFWLHAESVAVPEQDAAMFQSMLNKALAVDPDANPDHRLANLIAQRRARWLLERIDDLFLILPKPSENAGGL